MLLFFSRLYRYGVLPQNPTRRSISVKRNVMPDMWNTRVKLKLSDCDVCKRIDLFCHLPRVQQTIYRTVVTRVLWINDVRLSFWSNHWKNPTHHLSLPTLPRPSHARKFLSSQFLMKMIWLRKRWQIYLKKIKSLTNTVIPNPKAINPSFPTPIQACFHQAGFLNQRLSLMASASFWAARECRRHETLIL